MRNAIKEKVTAHLSTQIDTECKVVYLLCELRKLFEDDRDSVPFHFQLFVDWALHVNLSGMGARDFVEKLDRFVESALNGNTDISFEHIIHDNLALAGSFRSSLKDFLKLHQLPTRICDDDAWWNSFIHAYAGVIEDGSLSYKGEGLKRVLGTKFTKGRTVDNADLPFELNWEIFLKDGRRLEMTIQKNSKLGFAVHGAILHSAK